MLVHGLAVDDNSLERARQAIVERGLLGQAQVERMPLHSLPYLRDLANLVVLEDLADLASRGLKWSDFERCVAPGGVTCVQRNGGCTATKEVRPADMDDWTRPAHGPDANRVSADRLIELPMEIRWVNVGRQTGPLLSPCPCRSTITVAVRARAAHPSRQME